MLCLCSTDFFGVAFVVNLTHKSIVLSKDFLMLLLYNPHVALLLFILQDSHCSFRTLNLQHTLPFHSASSLGVKVLAPMLTFKVTQAGMILGGLLKKKV